MIEVRLLRGLLADHHLICAISLQRSFLDGEEWKMSANFSLAQLPAAIVVMQMAQDYVASKEASGSEWIR